MEIEYNCPTSCYTEWFTRIYREESQSEFVRSFTTKLYEGIESTLLSYAIRARMLSPDIFRLLFQHGFSLDGISVAKFLGRNSLLQYDRPPSYKSHRAARPPRAVYEATKEVTELFIVAGADLTAKIQSVENGLVSASDIIRSRFAADDVQYILSRAPPPALPERAIHFLYSSISRWLPFTKPDEE